MRQGQLPRIACCNQDGCANLVPRQSSGPHLTSSWYTQSIQAKSRMSTRNDDRRRECPPRHFSDQQPTRQRATDQEIQKWISRQHGFVPESAWKSAAIKQAFRRFGIL